ncbi:MAG: outer membrane beta-barrel protein, partial [Bacteroidota bacterium]
MIKNKLLLLLCMQIIVCKLTAQVQNTGMTDRIDSVEIGKLTISGYVDVYYGFDFNQPSSHERAYAVSASKHNELNINLAFMDIRYQGERVRGRFIPGVGTYINSNYSNEQGTLKNLVEAYAGIKLAKNKNIWLDAGVLGSPFTYESAISKDHLIYSRSLASEYSPYYLTGLRLSVPINTKITAYIYALNGWQQINDANNEPSLGTQVEYKINNNWLLNWSNYIGSERTEAQPLNRMRYFTDFY